MAAMSFFKDHGIDVATKSIDTLLFNTVGLSPQSFGALFGYRIALTILSRWKGARVLDNPVFATMEVHNTMLVLHYLHCYLECVMASWSDFLCGRFT